MNSDWPLITIDDLKSPTKGSIAIGPFGSRMKSDSYVETGIPVIRGTNITKGPNFEGEFVYISKEMADTLGSCNVYKDDLVFPHRGAIGEVGVVVRDERYVLSSSLMKLSCNKNLVLPQYLYYFFKSHLGRHELLKNASQVGTPGIGQPLTSLKGIELKLPPLAYQNKVVASLSSLDSKISQNKKINQSLEQIAQAIFKSWFVDFEPTKAKIAAREALLAENPAATADQIATAEQQAAIQAIAGAGDIIPTEQLQTIADLFPNQLVDSELGEMPEGWEVCISGELIDVRDGTHDSPKKAESGYPLVTSKHITSGVLKLEDTYLISEEDFEKVNKRSAVKTGDILLTMIGTVGIPYLVLDREVNFAIKNVGLFRTSKSKNHQFYFYFLLKTQMMQDYLEARMAGTTQKYLSLKVLRNLEFISPPLDSVLLDHFNSLITPITNLIQQNSQQTYSLAELRDSLLPKLLSGEISFEDKDID